MSPSSVVLTLWRSSSASTVVPSFRLISTAVTSDRPTLLTDPSKSPSTLYWISMPFNAVESSSDSTVPRTVCVAVASGSAGDTLMVEFAVAAAEPAKTAPLAMAETTIIVARTAARIGGFVGYIVFRCSE
ncbi:hypothetical protein BRD04_05015 [Halobacteriales archaeon QS_9_67_17]|nr:MAG: hypothetical protein BRD04_05015 [Halobacteriales archaeon QS_9_67_17]